MTRTTASAAETIRPTGGRSMHITESALSLNVRDVEASAAWVKRHLGFSETMSADGFCSLAHPEAGFALIYLRTGLGTFRPAAQAHDAGGLLVVFVVPDIDAQYERLRAEGVEIVTPIETEPWGERYFQMADPNGVVYQLVQWMTPEEEQQ
ncbi:VOC family protein [Microbacterium sp. JZ37]|uniref:VOC family protein n=1 Tax=Microbacterium sp. JZ37 TaxID=2654193 RepID=UPI002B46E2C6|nr:VOC family protein [Microbacterium sp. JZ37]